MAHPWLPLLLIVALSAEGAAVSAWWRELDEPNFIERGGPAFD